ncbi:pleckstrin homology domain-containing family G member 6 isoform X2 [Periophthalmus magnuspinnatus]|nr:pleckstrin homology domain-containing family G member 6 isoform X2 [Periophthalmus magnuspinnatus]
MTKTQRNQQDALWEFVSTELIYINKLLVIRHLVLESLLHLQKNGFLLEVTPQLLFSNLPSIIGAHQLFWQEVLYPMLQEVRRTGAPFDPMRLEAGCLQFRKRFSSYKHYCWEEESTQEFARRLQESNPQFHTYVQWIETHPQTERMRLGDMQAKPHQRITKYPLLLGAVLKNTSQPRVQQTLRAMLSTVIRFLESINDYMRFKDEELALSISAERVEGYEVEGINEEIDKRVREVSTFDLTCPVSGVGPGVLRRLLLEENLKIRGRKDSKMEIVALLFSDVLLMTKAQKKGERLKVIRPPLALDRTRCIALKDGCSFVLVEVGELLSVMNVYIFVTGTAHSCSTWVSTIQQAKETLRDMRDREQSRQMDKWRLLQLSKSQSDVNGDEAETEAPPTTPSEHDASEENQEITEPKTLNGPQRPQVVNGPQSPQTVNGPQRPQVVNGPQSPQTVNGPQRLQVATGLWSPQTEKTLEYILPFRQGSRPHPALQRKSVRKTLPARQPVTPGYEFIEMEVRSPGFRANSESRLQETSCGVETQSMNGKKVQSVPDLERHFLFDTTQTHNTRPHNPLPGGHPDVDPALNSTLQNTDSLGAAWKRASEVLSRRRPSDPLPAALSDTTDPSEGKGFPKDLRSPGLRRRRPLSTQGLPQSGKPPLHRAAHSWSASNNSSSDSDSSIPAKRNSVPSDKNSFRVLTLNSLKPNQGMFWAMLNDTASEPELPELNQHNKRAKTKTQRSASIPNMVLQDKSLQDKSLQRSSGNMTLPSPSPLQGLLDRAKERDRDSVRRDGKALLLRPKVPPSPSISTTSSTSPSEAERESEWEEVELLRHRVLSVSQGWREQLVDGDEDDLRNSAMFSDGVNVDWPGWCFDDEEVMDHLTPGGESLMEGINKSLHFWDLQEEMSEQEDGECSQV